jgi:hemerythrin
MKTKTTESDFLADNNKMLVEWGKRYATGIPLIDEQHKELINLTNKLFEACLDGEQTELVFKDTVRGVADYINYHFSAEEQMLEKINYPELAEHKKQHALLVKQVLENIRLFEEGRKFIPNSFVRAMKDWILTHIAVMDQRYAEYIVNLKKTGKLRAILHKDRDGPAVKNVG